ncbi:hypothetical protein NKH77_15760 [Streptomyces sp. M19]
MSGCAYGGSSGPCRPLCRPGPGPAAAAGPGRAVRRLAAWSALEAAQTALAGYALARALDDGSWPGRAAPA